MAREKQQKPLNCCSGRAFTRRFVESMEHRGMYWRKPIPGFPVTGSLFRPNRQSDNWINGITTERSGWNRATLNPIPGHLTVWQKCPNTTGSYSRHTWEATGKARHYSSIYRSTLSVAFFFFSPTNNKYIFAAWSTRAKDTNTLISNSFEKAVWVPLDFCTLFQAGSIGSPFRQRSCVLWTAAGGKDFLCCASGFAM